MNAVAVVTSAVAVYVGSALAGAVLFVIAAILVAYPIPAILVAISAAVASVVVVAYRLVDKNSDDKTWVLQAVSIALPILTLGISILNWLIKGHVEIVYSPSSVPATEVLLDREQKKFRIILPWADPKDEEGDVSVH
jgi:hypothetical protein